ncbi:AAA family ATPase [Streptomyces sp. NBC_00124]|uniref:AAA family ATPase n=1 Tax=Streptomyces sp. NBC_00124 TaxID=2975662 RepID=UPI0022568667|nr:AAA family ATPase [Streptomyces sp. NBC_00124]MCX5360045.1 AAA family ATPase [Streptomyces sp. NBC_00124]
MTGGYGSDIHILPYSYVVGQAELKLGLELNYIAPRIGGVLISGQRGTAKSTVVRAFSLMTRGELPVTLPINATDDRVLGGWELDALMQGRALAQPGLLEESGKKGMLYIDEVNLLDDHIVNIILDVVSTGVLSVQREGIDAVLNLSFGLVGTMNPEEGGLRPQLLDRFGLMVSVSELDQQARRRMVLAVLRFDDQAGTPSPWLAEGLAADQTLKKRLDEARASVRDVRLSDDIAELCADVASRLRAVGHRGEVVTAWAARALAALEGAPEVTNRHVREVVPLSQRHRRPEAAHGGPVDWTAEELELLDELLG